jgi:hypothetical protein
MKTWTLALALAALAACQKELVCPAGQGACGGTCAALATDVNNCGACGTVCAVGESCAAGHCVTADGRVDCGGRSVDLASSATDCGACGHDCGGLFCTTSGGATACAEACGSGQTACGHDCIELPSDRFNCGACGRACGTNERCSGGECLANLYVSCGDTNQVTEATDLLAPAGTSQTVGVRPVTLAWLDGRLYTADSIGGSLSELRFDLPAPAPVAVARTLQIDTVSAFPDLEYVAAGNGLLFVSNASLGNLDVVNPASGAVMAETHLDPAGTDGFTGPAGIAVANGKAYVALNGADAVAVVDVSACQPLPPACGAGNDCSAHPGTGCVNGQCIATSCGQLLQRIALPATFASTATGPTPYRLLAVGSRLYVTLQNLDRANTFKPAGDGRLAMIDLATDTLVQDGAGPLAVTLTGCTNPSDLALVGNDLYIGCGYYDFFGGTGASGKAMARVSIAGAVPALAEVVAMDHVLGAVTACDGAVYLGSSDTGDVVRYDPVSRSVSKATLCPLDKNGIAYVADLKCPPSP